MAMQLNAAIVVVAAVLTVGSAARADVSIGLGGGAHHLGRLTSYAIAPQAEASAVWPSGWSLLLRDSAAVTLPVGGAPLGIVNTATAGAGHVWQRFAVNLTAGVALYRAPACGFRCEVVEGVAPALSIAIDSYLPMADDSIGVRLVGTGTWFVGDSVVLSGPTVGVVASLFWRVAKSQ